MESEIYEDEEQGKLIFAVMEKLKSVAHFEYLTLDGSIREAYGTTNPNLIPKYNENRVLDLVSASYAVSESLSSGVNEEGRILDMESMDTHRKVLGDALVPFQPRDTTPKSMPEGRVNYYDFEKAAFRKFDVDRLSRLF